MNINKIARWLGDKHVLVSTQDEIFKKCCDKLHWHYESIITIHKPSVINCWRCEIKATDLNTGVRASVYAENANGDRDAFFDALDKFII